MTTLARSERAALCDTALAFGEGRPTLCAGWTVKDLVVHLLVREGSLASIGIVVAPLARFTEAESRRVARSDFADLVSRLRVGPPRLSPFAIPKLDELGNSLEFFIHHEDIRRAEPGWTARLLGRQAEAALWPSVRMLAKRPAKAAPVAVHIEDKITGRTAELSQGDDTVTVRGLPSEIALFMSGRGSQADVDLLGSGDAVARLRATPLGG